MHNHRLLGEFPCLNYFEFTQALVFTTTPPGTPYVGGAYQVGASSSLDLTPAFSSLTTTVRTVASTTVTLVGPGTCIVAADQRGEYPDKLPAPQVTQSFTLLTAWPFTGFLSPISNTKPNAAKAGSAVPVKFTLGGAVIRFKSAEVGQGTSGADSSGSAPFVVTKCFHSRCAVFTLVACNVKTTQMQHR